MNDNKIHCLRNIYRILFSISVLWWIRQFNTINCHCIPIDKWNKNKIFKHKMCECIKRLQKCSRIHIYIHVLKTDIFAWVHVMFFKALHTSFADAIIIILFPSLLIKKTTFFLHFLLLFHFINGFVLYFFLQWQQ